MRNQRRFERKVYRKRERRKKWKARRNYRRNREKKSIQRRIKRTQNRSQTIQIPRIFSLATGRDEVLSFFHSLKKIEKEKGRFLFFDFSKVREINHGAITILLSFIGWLNDRGFHASGNDPIDQQIKEQFEKSGFLNFFKKIGTRNYEKGENTIVAVGETKTNAELSAKLIRKSTKTVWGEEGKNVKVQGMLIELMANTINHAYLGKIFQKGWYFSVDHNKEQNIVKFCFVDNGLGILSTINKKFKDKILGLLNADQSNLIKRAFEGEFGSRTRISNRGRGLKAIKKVYDAGFIKSLKVITNDVFYDFENNSVEALNESFEGTFYFWQIDKTCNR